jgi:predicted RNase H-like HicB family nuclease
MSDDVQRNIPALKGDACALDRRRGCGKIAAMRQALVYPGEDGFWVAECPSLPGCISQGETRDQAIVNIREAIEGYVLALKDDGLPVPEEKFDAMLVAV